jgi:hypothetical protein
MGNKLNLRTFWLVTLSWFATTVMIGKKAEAAVPKNSGSIGEIASIIDHRQVAMRGVDCITRNLQK